MGDTGNDRLISFGCYYGGKFEEVDGKDLYNGGGYRIMEAYPSCLFPELMNQLPISLYGQRVWFKFPYEDDEDGVERDGYLRYIKGSGDLKLRQAFESLEAFKKAMVDYVLKHRWNIKYVRWEKDKSELKCASEAEEGEEQCLSSSSAREGLGTGGGSSLSGEARDCFVGFGLLGRLSVAVSI
ncbi:hypothetical protein F2Q69_00011701 [Brassica cretica]|uniref:Uncharacterized protein n=1 Tax=Brassica cretica TaxID=69181 RepID=A0A8S9QZ86_BRACR|nr:hypothetical protein F2Q69_00011701 [Brassica cretica]